MPQYKVLFETKVPVSTVPEAIEEAALQIRDLVKAPIPGSTKDYTFEIGDVVRIQVTRLAEALTQYDHENIRYLIDGYMTGKRHNEAPAQYFQRAKNELVVNLEKRLGKVKDYTFADFTKKLK